MRARACLVGLVALAACGSAAKTATTAATTGTTPVTVPATTAPPTTEPATTVPPTTAAPTTTTTTTTLPPTTTTTTRTTVPPTAPPTTIDPMVDAANFYRQQAAATGTEWNAAVKPFPAYPKTIPFRTWPKYCAAIAPIIDKYARALGSYTWPDKVKAVMQAEINDLAAEAGTEYLCAKLAGTAAALGSVTTQLHAIWDKRDADTSATRVALGLPLN